jgi:DNA-binding FrmR family transcriptional regulator
MQASEDYENRAPDRPSKLREKSMEADKNVDNKQTEERIAADGQQCCCHRTKKRTEKEYRDLINRLSRIEGQIRGIKGMVEKNSYCPDIMIQVAAANAALNSFNKALLAEHIRSCVATDIREGRDETIEELVETLQKVMK